MKATVGESLGVFVGVLSALVSVVSIIYITYDHRSRVVYPLAHDVTHKVSRIRFFTEKYGYVEGSVLADAISYKESAQEDSNIVAVAGTIIAQITITALSLEGLSDTHWVARAFFTFSLVSAIMAIYYATRQYRTLGRYHRVDQIKTWIRGKRCPTDTASTLPSKMSRKHLDLPSTAAVLTVSTPNMLMSASLDCLLVGVGIYFGFTWTKNLDETAGHDGSRAVFMMYISGLVFCYAVYTLLGAVVASDSHVSEHDLLNQMEGVLPTSQHIAEDEETATSASNQPEVSTLIDGSSVGEILGRSGSSPKPFGPNRDGGCNSVIFARDSTRAAASLARSREAA
ncbi:hypothetical protein G6011_02626 [Alternaria panax]|uniref:Uncharacterized protein n=1 Tax=Alternaria panax TaxID=48097 RepID=A0AAD4F9Z9_9PLEO|nr:hypothetical protein G6011_02626 [Alternaria panax]